MDQQLAALNLQLDLEQIRQEVLPAELDRWAIALVGPVCLDVSLSPGRDPVERYQARLTWPDYPDRPPSVRFVEPATGRLDLSRAWPDFPGVRPPQDISAPWTSDGHAAHPEWHADSRYRWSSHGNPLLRILRTLQEQLDDEYLGRFP